ncbi:sugar porter family MFS transporter [Parafilimonas sp.]|uniref:sugar porter family MFS transporter n=1 Tax=Parafilimonas sp. TaxID=1969739 RepID=UPI003F81EBCB
MNFNKRINYICFAVALGGLLFGFDTAVISGAISFVKTQFSLDTVAEGWMVSSGLLGSIIGVFATGIISDKIGRKKTIIVAAIMFLLSGFGCGFASSFTLLVIARMIGGIGVGMASVISPMYISEFAPADKRGRMVAYYQLAITLGILLAYLSNAYILSISDNGTSELLQQPWRGMFVVMCIPSLLFLLMLVKVPESPRWLVEINRQQEAQKILYTVRPKAAADKEFNDILHAKSRAKTTSVSLLHPSVRIPLIIGIVLAVLQQFSGINAIIYYGPNIFQSAGLDSSNALMFQVIIGTVNFLSTIIAIAYADKYGRKFLLKTGLTGIIISLILCGILFYTNHTQGYLLLVLMMLYIICFAFSIGPVTWIIINEIFPTHVRVKAVTVCTMALWIAVWLVGQFFPWLLEKAGPAFTFWAFAIFSLINLLFSLTVVKETKGKTLEEMDTAFVAPH